MSETKKNALSIKRAEDFSKWYQAVISESGLAERSSVRGCMVIKPFGYTIWENMQSILDKKFKELGHVNAYFPMFIPIDLFQKEADHINGFAKEMAIVTHSKLENIDGKLTPTGKIETPLAIRPTSEMIIGESFSKWIKSYRDLPILVNQWCNVVRWEMRTRLFLRTMEFLWQEGHTAHETEDEAREETIRMHDVYHWFINDVLKIYCIKGKKPVHEKFPGAVDTYTIEAMMQDGKALQCATSHFLGQHFSKAVGIQFQARDGSLQYAYTTSWGISTRMIGGLIMSHADDDGLNTPISIAPYHIVIIPIIKNEDDKERVLDYADRIKSSVPSHYRIYIDTKDIPSQNKKWDYIRKGTPIICEIGIKDIENSSIYFTRRQPQITKNSLKFDEFIGSVSKILEEHDESLYQKSMMNSESKTRRDIKNIDEFKEFFSSEDNGFVIGKWSEDPKSLKILDELGVTVRCCPIKNDSIKSDGRCILTGKDAKNDYIFARSY